ncbi:MAG: ATP-binding cassette domain-containing protein, partial [Chloroflexi bacterium]|nr:ATP-binding cassette domain-containing protein [Chloroflexota bacterium]
MSLLEVKEVKSGYGRMLVLHGVDLSVAEGALTVLLGPNGAGKTTLMQTIFGLLPLAAGSVQFQGESIAGLDPALIARKGIGYVPQENSVFPDLTVHENLEMGGFSLKDSRKTVNEVYELFPRLKERVTQKAGTLSGGERQMLAVGCALLLKPRLLILDEPTTGLAPQMREVLIETIREINNRGTSI